MFSWCWLQLSSFIMNLKIDFYFVSSFQKLLFLHHLFLSLFLQLISHKYWSFSTYLMSFSCGFNEIIFFRTFFAEFLIYRTGLSSNSRILSLSREEFISYLRTHSRACVLLLLLLFQWLLILRLGYLHIYISTPAFVFIISYSLSVEVSFSFISVNILYELIWIVFVIYFYKIHRGWVHVLIMFMTNF